MARRLVISDAVWAELEPVLPALKHNAGSPPQLSERMFIEAALYQARTGTPWRDLPDDFGNREAVYNRFRRWDAQGYFRGFSGLLFRGGGAKMSFVSPILTPP